MRTSTTTINPAVLVDLIGDDGRARIADAAADAAFQMLSHANRDTEKLARRAVRRVSTPRLVAFAEQLYEASHRRLTAGFTNRVAEALGPASDWEARAREELDCRAAEAI